MALHENQISELAKKKPYRIIRMNKRSISWVLRAGTARLLTGLIHLYQHTLSILFGPCCRFTPCCSSYASLAIKRFGIREGIWLALKRLIRCHPFNPGGYDPVPCLPSSQLTAPNS